MNDTLLKSVESSTPPQSPHTREQVHLTMISEFRGSYPDIPLPADIDLQTLRALTGDEELFFVTLPIAEVNGVSRNGRSYSKQAVLDIIESVNLNRPDGIWGHMSEAELATRYDPPSIKWLVATLDSNGIAWAKGLPLNKDTRDYYRFAKATNSQVATSIFGWANVEGSVVKSLSLEQIDIAQPTRAGIPATSSVPQLTREMNDSFTHLATPMKLKRPVTLQLVSEISDPFASNLNIDRDNLIIYNTTVMMADVEALGHGFVTDQKTITKIAELGQRAKNGVMGKFDHPRSGDDMGKQILQAENFRVDDKAVLADLHFFKEASNSPVLGDSVLSWVFDMAENHPAHLALSVVVSGYWVWVLDSGAEIRIPDWEFYWGMYERPDNATTDMPILRPEQLWGVDMVSEGAATRGLFGQENTLTREMNEGQTMSDTNQLVGELAVANARVTELEQATEAYEAQVAEQADQLTAYSTQVSELTQQVTDITALNEALVAENAALLETYIQSIVAEQVKVEKARKTVVKNVTNLNPSTRAEVDTALQTVLEREDIKEIIEALFVSEMGNPLQVPKENEPTTQGIFEYPELDKE